MKKFLLAKLVDGTKIVAEFSRLGGTGQGYAAQVMSLRKPFNAWRVVSTTNPVNGEPALVRTRDMISGRQVVSMTPVKPKAGYEETHEYHPDNFEPASEVQAGRFGIWNAPKQGGPEGCVPGGQYVVHRDPQSLRRYVILRTEQAPAAIGGEPTPEVRHYLDDAGTVSGGQMGAADETGMGAHHRPIRPADSDDDLGEDGLDGGDD